MACDQVGTPKVVTDAAGTVVKKLDYDSFGQLVSDSAPAFYLPIGFAGGLADVDTGLVRFGFRDYDPAAGRWTAKDPIVFSSGQANLYGYCGSDPVGFVDLNGLLVLPALVIGGEALANTAMGMAAIGVDNMEDDDDIDEDESSDANYCYLAHTKNARPSTAGKHERGEARQATDANKKEKGDIRRRKRGRYYKIPK